MAYCRNCGEELDDSAKFCPNCGAPCDGEASPRLSDGGVDYQELKFSASVVNARKKRTLAFSFAVICSVLDLVYLITNFIANIRLGFIGSLLYTPILIVLLAVCLPKILTHYANSTSKKLSENSTLGDLRIMQQDSTLCLSILIVSIPCLLMNFIVSVSGDFIYPSMPHFKLMFSEPELLSLMYGKAYCVSLYMIAIIILLSVAMSVYVFPIQIEHKNLYRYFLGKIAPDTPAPIKGRASKAEKAENKKLIAQADKLTLGEEFEKAVTVYYECFPDEEKEVIKNLKTEAACVKYRRLKGITALSFVALFAVFILWAALGSSHSSQTVRAGNAARIELGSDRYAVERILYTPDSKAGNCYIYTDDSLKDADVDSFDDLEDLMNKKIKELRVYFMEDKVYEVIYDAGDYHSLKPIQTFNVGRRYDGKYIYHKLDYYKDGSIRIYEDIF